MKDLFKFIKKFVLVPLALGLFLPYGVNLAVQELSPTPEPIGWGTASYVFSALGTFVISFFVVPAVFGRSKKMYRKLFTEISHHRMLDKEVIFQMKEGLYVELIEALSFLREVSLDEGNVKQDRPRASEAIKKFIGALKSRPVYIDIRHVKNELLGAESNILATSSESISLWEDSAFQYYFVIQIVKTLLERTKAAGTPRAYTFSPTLDKDLTARFSEEENRLLAQLAEGKIPDEFFMLRFLVYDKKDYDENAFIMTPLIKVHQMLGMHCLPLLKEEVIKKMDDEGYRNKFGLNKKDLKRLEKAVDQPNVRIPDLLMIDCQIVNSDETDTQVWFYEHEKRTPERVTENRATITAQKLMFMFADMAKKPDKNRFVWNSYGGTKSDDIALYAPLACSAHPDCPERESATLG